MTPNQEYFRQIRKFLPNQESSLGKQGKIWKIGKIGKSRQEEFIWKIRKIRKVHLENQEDQESSFGRLGKFIHQIRKIRKVHQENFSSILGKSSSILGKFLLNIRKIPPQKTGSRRQKHFFQLCFEIGCMLELLWQGAGEADHQIPFIIVSLS